MNEPTARAMTEALQQALRGTRTRNPLVGATVLDRDGNIAATGFHPGAGSPHAEVNALAAARAAGVDLSKATLVVTLEPCAHHGTTSPCAETIARAGIPRVVFLASDPTEASGGADFLRKRGVTVEKYDDESRLPADSRLLAEQLNARWFRAKREQRPFVIAKSARTFDGYIAARDGSSKWITNAAARSDAHVLRSRVDAIAVGAATALADNPRLTARDSSERTLVRPIRVVFGMRSLRPGSHLDDPATIRLSGAHLASDLRHLYRKGVGSLLIEGGGKLVSSFLRAGLVDQFISYVAADLMGSGNPAVSFPGVDSIGERQSWMWDPSGMGASAWLGTGADLNLRLQTIPKEG